MILLGNFINGIALVLQVILGLIEIVLVLTAIFSWFPQARYNQTVIFLNMITNIILKPIRKFVPSKSGVDFAFIIALLIVIFLQAFLVTSLFDYAKVIKNI